MAIPSSNINTQVNQAAAANPNPNSIGQSVYHPNANGVIPMADVPPNPAGASTTANAQKRVRPTAYKALVIKLEPQWNYFETNKKPVKMSVMPPRWALERNAEWGFSIRILTLPSALMNNPKLSKTPHEKSITDLGLERIFLKYKESFYSEFFGEIDESQRKENKVDFKKIIACAIYPGENEKIPNVLSFAHKQTPNENNKDQAEEGYIKLIQGGTYRLRITFNEGSNIVNAPNIENWEPQIYINYYNGTNLCSMQITTFDYRWIEESTFSDRCSTLQEELVPNDYEEFIIDLPRALPKTILSITTMASTLEDALFNKSYDPNFFALITSYLYCDKILNKMKNDSKIANECTQLIDSFSKKGQEQVVSNMSIQPSNAKRSMLQLFNLALSATSKPSSTGAIENSAGTAAQSVAAQTAAAGTVAQTFARSFAADTDGFIPANPPQDLIIDYATIIRNLKKPRIE